MLKRQLEEMAGQIEEQEQALARLSGRIAEAETHLSERTAAARGVSEELQQERLLARTSEERLAQLDKQHSVVEQELSAASDEHDRASTAQRAAAEQLRGIEQALAELETKLNAGGAQLNELEQARQRFGREAGATKIDMVKSEQRWGICAGRRASSNATSRSAGERWPTAARTWKCAQERLQDASRNILRAESEVAELYLRKEAYAAEMGQTSANARELARAEGRTLG